MIELKLRRQDRTLRMEEGTYGFCFGGKDAPDPPDYSGVARSSEQNARISAEIAREQLAWAREQWADQKDMISQITDVQLPIMQAQAEMAGQGMDAYLSMMEMQQEVAWENHKNAMQDRDRYERIFQPIEDDLVQEFMAYDTEGRKALEAGRAQSDVARAQDAQRKQAVMSLESYGIDPSQTRSQALDATLRTQQAAAQAAAGNQARENVENTGRALRAEAINIGKGLPSNVAASYGTALNAGAGAQGAHNANMGQLGNTMQGLGQNAGAWQGASDAMGSPGSWMGASNQAIGQWGNTLNMGYQNQLGAANYNAQNSIWGQMSPIIGMGLGAWMAEGGEVDGPGGPKDDAIPARLSDGEYVIPAEVVHRKGTEFFDKLRDKTLGEIQEQQAQLDADQQEAQAKQAAMQMQMPAEHPQHLGYGGAAMYADGGSVYDGALGYAPGQYGQVYEGEYWGEPEQAFAEGGSVYANTDYGFHGNQMSQPMAYMAEGGEANNTENASGLWSGANTRPMFGYDSKAAQQGKKMQQAAMNNRARLTQNLQQQMAAKEWQNVEPDWQPAKFGRTNFDVGDAIATARQSRLDEANAQRAHELALAEAKQTSQGSMEDYYNYRKAAEQPWGKKLSYEEYQNLSPKQRAQMEARSNYQSLYQQTLRNPYGGYDPYGGVSNWWEYNSG